MLRSTKVPLPKKLTDKRRERGRAEYQDFPSIIFCLTVPKDFVGGGRGGEYQHFPSKNFCLTVPKFSFGKPFSVSLVSGIEKVWIRGGEGGGGRSIKILRGKIFVSGC